MRNRHFKKRPIKKINDIVNYDQSHLIDKLNSYLTIQDRKNDDGDVYRIQTGGYCHGLTLLWLEKMMENKVSWFYSVQKKIIRCADDKLNDIELDIEKFLAMIEWAQQSSQYTMGNICYDNIDLILETDDQKSLDQLYTFNQLNETLNRQQGKNHMICITSCDGEEKEHSVGVFTDGLQYYFYDANYSSGEATYFNSSRKLTHEIVERLYTNFKKRIPQQLLLEVKVISAHKKNNRNHDSENDYLSTMASFWKPKSGDISSTINKNSRQIKINKNKIV